MKLGRVRPKPLGPHFRLRNYLRASLPNPPTSVDYAPRAMASLSQVMLNDQLGDCVIAMRGHLTGVATGNANGTPFVYTDAQALTEYERIGGYVPGDSSTDQGCDEVSALNDACQVGFADGTKALGWLVVDQSNAVEVMTAQWLFGNLCFAVELPDTYVNPFPSGSGFIWDTGRPDPQNGHAFLGCGYTTEGVQIATWGLIGTMTYGAIADLCAPVAGGGLYVVLTPDWLIRGQQLCPAGVAWSDLIADFDSMGGAVPQPAPAPPPAPVPGGPVSLAQAQAMAVGALQAAHPLLTRGQAISIVQVGLTSGWPVA